MTTKPQSFGDLADDLSSRLHEINAIVRLCGFADEARRVLTDIDDLCEITPEVDEQLKRSIQSRNDWLCHEYSLAQVLKDVARKIEAVHDLINDPEVHDAICP